MELFYYLILILISHQTCSQFAKTTGSQIICKRQVIWSISYILILKRSLNLSTATEKTTTWSDKEYRYIYVESANQKTMGTSKL